MARTQHTNALPRMMDEVRQEMRQNADHSALVTAETSTGRTLRDERYEGDFRADDRAETAADAAVLATKTECGTVFFTSHALPMRCSKQGKSAIRANVVAAQHAH